MNTTVGTALLGLTSIFVIGGCAQAPTAQSGRVLTGEEIKSLLTYRSEETTTPEGGIWRAYHPDSETEIGRYTDPNGKTTDARSRKSYKAEAVCAQWDRKDWGYKCFQIVQDGEKITYRNLKDKNDFGQIKVLEGNPFGF